VRRERTFTSLLRPRVAALLLVFGLASAWLGVAAPAGLAAPDAAKIDAFLAAHSSLMTGTGDAFVAEGAEHGVDPAFLVAIAGAESSFGVYLYSENGDVCTFNAFNWFYGQTWPQSDFDSWTQAIARVAEGLSGSLYYGSGLFSVEAIAPRYCPDGTDNWIANVTAFMAALGGDPADTRLDGAVSATPERGLVTLEGEVALSRRSPRVGQLLTATFTLVNGGEAPVALEDIRLVIRGPWDAPHDMVSDVPLTLQPGESRLVTARWRPDTVGTWYGWIEVSQDGESGLVGDTRAFSFSVRVPRGERAHEALLRADQFDHLP
jgi:hypothetical protein